MLLCVDTPLHVGCSVNGEMKWLALSTLQFTKWIRPLYAWFPCGKNTANILSPKVTWDLGMVAVFFPQGKHAYDGQVHFVKYCLLPRASSFLCSRCT